LSYAGEPSSKLPLVSVIINTLDRADSLDCTLSSLNQLRYPNFEVILVRGPCVDHTNEIIAKYLSKVRIALCSEANLATSRNTAIAIAAGEVVAFLDDDAIPEPDWLDLLVERFADPQVAAVGGFIRDYTGVKFQYRNVIANRFADVRHSANVDAPRFPDEYPSPTGTNIAIRRDVLIRIGGFDEHFSYFLEETDVNLRLHEEGWRICLIPEAQVHHKFLENRIRDAKRIPRSRYVIARSKAYFSWIHGSKTKKPRQIRAYLRTYRLQHIGYMGLLFILRRISWRDCARLAEEIDRGVLDGTRHATASEGQRALAPIKTGDCTDLYKRFPTILAAEDRMRICILINKDHGVDTDEVALQMYATAQALAERGHEVSVICLSASRSAGVEFVRGFWLHRVTVKPLFRLFAGLAHNEWTLLGQAGSREIVRIQDRRKFQMVILPYDGRVTSPVLEALGLPVVAVRLFSRSRGPVEQFAPSFDVTAGGMRVLALEGSGVTDANLKTFESQLSKISDPLSTGEPGAEQQRPGLA
jgi:glycogen(starch) synthase